MLSSKAHTVTASRTTEGTAPWRISRHVKTEEFESRMPLGALNDSGSDHPMFKAAHGDAVSFGTNPALLAKFPRCRCPDPESISAASPNFRLNCRALRRNFPPVSQPKDGRRHTLRALPGIPEHFFFSFINII